MNFKDKFLRNSVLMFMSMSVVNIANLLYQILAVRKLTIPSYGIFNSLISVFTIFSLPVASIATMIAKFTSHYHHRGEHVKADYFISVLLKHMFFVGLFLCLAYFVFGNSFKEYLHLDSALPVYFVGLMLFSMILLTVTLGSLQGFERFKWYSVGSISNSVSRVVLAAFMIYLGWDLLGVLGAYAVSQTIALLITLIPLREVFFIREKITDINMMEKYKFVIPSIITFGCFAALTNADVILVRHFLEPMQAGNYSVAQLIGKIVIFIPTAVYVVMLPSVSGQHAQNKDTKVILKRSLKYTALLCLLASLAYNLFPQFILNLLTNKANNEIVLLGRLFTISMLFFSLLIVLLLYQLAISKFMFLKNLAVFTILQVIGIVFYHNSPVQVLSIVIINSVILCFVNMRLALRHR